ncbi:uncharacterized protein [Bemisia tabaci]|uniref:uncharacterized protein isoform X2 n=1 Tax=Bemisia tabaci TaxID=7038 RepID=UPI0008F99E74|nr:PREDICTED: longitudinals lacking protein, isoforms H/M/V-like isoform X2 [Bemisia tabaci]
MGSNQMYSLSWGDFGSSLASTFQILRGQGELVDVTLSAGGRIFPAHKLVLSAASPLLMELLKSTQCQHPVVMLAGITASDLEALLAFIYQGEVSVDPSQLPSLLQAAHCLDITALSPTILSTDKPVFVNHPPEVVVTPSTVDMSSVSNTSMMHSDESSSALPVRKRKQVKRKSSELPNTSMGEKWARVGEENTDPVQASMSDSMVSVKHEGSGEEGAGPPPLKVLRSASDQPCGCPLCGAVIRQARNLRRHLLTACKYRLNNPLESVTSGSEPEVLECMLSPLPTSSLSPSSSCSSPKTITSLTQVPPC